MIVVDASTVTAALIDGGPDGRWAESVLSSAPSLAPHLLPVEVASILRRGALRGDLSADAAALAHGALLDLPITLLPYGAFADRVWELRGNVTPYDAWYVAVAEALESPLATLDARLSRADGPRCEFLLPS